MYECFHCGRRTVIWDIDFTFEDCGYEGEGIVHFCHCDWCGAEIEYRISSTTDGTSDSTSDGTFKLLENKVFDQLRGTTDGTSDGTTDSTQVIKE